MLASLNFSRPTTPTHTANLQSCKLLNLREVHIQTDTFWQTISKNFLDNKSYVIT